MNPYVLLAKSAAENYVREKKTISPPDNLPKDFLTKRSGVFVTIKNQGRLRGCIGTYLPTTENIAKEIIQNAITAATEDYRFGSVQKEELPHLSYTVYILNKPEPVKEIEELDPKKYGIIVKTVPISAGGDVMFDGHAPLKSGLLLPDLEGIDIPEQQISIACQKGGIDPTREKIIVYKFTVEKHGKD
jgi:AmmeMemoRadiSam system protein A